MEGVRLYREPVLNSPFMVAAWPGMGGVAVVAARYLRDKLDAQEFGEIEPYDFFDPNVVLIQDNIVKEPEFPENKFYLREGGGEGDLIIFIGEEQPVIWGYKLANRILDVAQRFKAKRVYTFAAAPSHIYHAKKPRILGVTTNPKLTPELSKHGLTLMTEGNISGMNGLLLGVAKERNIDGVCLLGEIPIYTTQIANPRSSEAVLQVLSQMADVKIDVTEIDNWAKKTDEEMEENIDRLRRSFGEEAKTLIDYLDQLKQRMSEEELGIQQEYQMEQLLEEIEQFLRGKGKKGEN